MNLIEEKKGKKRERGKCWKENQVSQVELPLRGVGKFWSFEDDRRALEESSLSPDFQPPSLPEEHLSS